MNKRIITFPLLLPLLISTLSIICTNRMHKSLRKKPARQRRVVRKNTGIDSALRDQCVAIDHHANQVLVAIRDALAKSEKLNNAHKNPVIE